MTTSGPPDDATAVRRKTVLFAVRLWNEEVPGGTEVRGSVRDVVSGAFCGFRDWSDLAAFMVARLDETEPGAASEISI
jgi:hypothetical protein